MLLFKVVLASIVGLYTLCWVSLIGGVGYRVEQWGGKWDGMMGVANLCNWYCCSRLCWLLCVKGSYLITEAV